MYSFILIIHCIVCVLLILIVLFQAGKTLGLGSLTGSGSGDAIMTGAGGNLLLKKVTAFFAVLFLVTSLTLSFMSAKRPSRSLMDIMPPTPILPEADALTGGKATADKAVAEPTKPAETKSK